MGRQDEFDAGSEHVTLWHGTKGDPESIRQHGIDIGRSNPHDPVVWLTQRPIHKPEGWIQGSGWGMKYRTPSFDHIAEVRLSRSEVADQLDHPLNQNMQNVRLNRSVRPDEVVAVHDMQALHGPRIAKAYELQSQGPPKRKPRSR
jgi:hypothetical protein